MKTCYKCNCPLTKGNKTTEHIIQNSLGGRLKSRDLICTSCNANFGKTYDRVLADQMNFFVNLLNVARHRKKAQPIEGQYKSSGMRFQILQDGSINRAEPEVVDDSGVISIQAGNRKQLETVLHKLRQKYPQIDVKEIIKNATESQGFLSEALSFNLNLGGIDAHRAIAKIAVNFFIYKGGNRKHIQHILPFLDGGGDSKIVILHYPEKDMYSPSANEISHVIRLVGNPDEGVLYAYIELFNVHCVLVSLSDKYDGANMNETYVFDLINKKNVETTIPFNYSCEKISALFKNTAPVDSENVKRRYDRLIQIAISRRLDAYVRDVLNRVLKKYSDKTVFTEEMLNELVAILGKEIIPALILPKITG